MKFKIIGLGWGLLCLLSSIMASGQSNFSRIIQLADSLGVDHPEFVEGQIKHYRSPHYEDDTTVYIWSLSEEKEIKIEGDIQNGWSQQHLMETIPVGSAVLHYEKLVLPKNAQAEYRFVVQGVRMPDPQNSALVKNPDFGDRSLLQMPGYASSTYLTRAWTEKRGSLDTFTYASGKKYFQERMVIVYLPNGYTKEQSYKSLYVNDGIGAIQQGEYLKMLDNMIYAGVIEPLVVVFVPAVNRNNEYFSLKNSKFIEHFSSDFVEFVERKYSCSKSAKDRGIIGISAGANMALHAGLCYPGVFGNIGAQSFLTTRKLYSDLDRYVKSGNKLNSIYLDVGRYDLEFGVQSKSLLEEVDGFRKTLQKNDVSHHYRLVNDGHQWNNWKQRFPDILMILFPN